MGKPKITMQMLSEIIKKLEERVANLELDKFHKEWDSKIEKLKNKDN